MATEYFKISELLPVDAATLTNDEPIPTVQAGATKAVTGNGIITKAGFRGAGSYVVGLESLIRSLIQGLKLTRASTTTITVDPGVVGDSTFTQGLKLEAATTKSTSAWGVGNAGGLDTGAIANNTWYAVYLIKRPDTEVVDVIFSTNGTSPTMPANYTLFRRIGWVRTNGSAQFVAFTQIGRKFIWDAKVVELNVATPASANRILQTVTTPKSVRGLFVVTIRNSASDTFLDMGNTAITDVAASISNFKLQTVNAVSEASTGNFELDVDASNQVYRRVNTATSTTITLLTEGWIDDLIA